MTERSDAPAGQTAIKARPRPGAYLLESVRQHAEYWINNGREHPDRGTAFLAVEQAANAWKNAAYDFAEKLHFSGYLDPLTGNASTRERRESCPVHGESAFSSMRDKSIGSGGPMCSGSTKATSAPCVVDAKLLACRFMNAEKKWLPVIGECYSVGVDPAERDLVVAALRHYERKSET